MSHNFLQRIGLILVWFSLCSIGCSNSKVPNFPNTINEYLEQRESLLEAEKDFEGRKLTLNGDEKIVDQFLGYLKWKEMKASQGKGFPSSRPIEESLPKIRESELYDYFAKFPKGGNLHSHETQQLSNRALFDIMWNCKDFEHLYVALPTVGPVQSNKTWMLDFFVNPPTDENWVKVKDSGYTKEEIMLKSDILGLLTEDVSRYPTDTRMRWEIFSKLLFRSTKQLIENIEVKKEYFLAMYKEIMDEGVQYIETRKVYDTTMLYELDFSGASKDTNGKKYLNTNLTFEIDIILDSIRQFKALNPKFIGHKIIISAFRSKTSEDFKKRFDIAIELHKLYPDLIIGFDASNEEDDGYSNLFFVEKYLTGHGSIPLYLHSVETSWPDDLLVGSKEDDLLPPLQNAYEVLLLQTRRAGHGKGFLKKPYLRKLLKERDIAVEVCPTSNQILGYDADLRNHYGQVLYREGIPIVVGSDDQACFGWYDGMVLEWFAIYTSWGFNLADLKTLALNSLSYSGMTNVGKEDAIKNLWEPSWNEYISEMKNIACRRNYEAEGELESRPVTFNHVLPKRGTPGTKVYIFGRNFEVAICKKIACKFGNITSEAIYLSNQRLICIAPKCPACDPSLISISLDGKTFQSTRVIFTYRSEPEKKLESSAEKTKLHLLFNCFIIFFVNSFS